MPLFLVYGSLRATSKRGYNFNRFGKDTQRYIRTLTLPGFNLYSLGVYPCITRGDNELVAELHDVDDKAARHIERMEIGAGYEPTTVTLPEGKATIFVYPKPCGELVPSGDWN
jgi:gamma-glutamylcyclotransferase (GGCT)/AIG2-like uncharacterized protein YtfP